MKDPTTDRPGLEAKLARALREASAALGRAVPEAVEIAEEKRITAEYNPNDNSYSFSSAAVRELTYEQLKGMATHEMQHEEQHPLHGIVGQALEYTRNASAMGAAAGLTATFFSGIAELVGSQSSFTGMLAAGTALATTMAAAAFFGEPAVERHYEYDADKAMLRVVSPEVAVSTLERKEEYNAQFGAPLPDDYHPTLEHRVEALRKAAAEMEPNTIRVHGITGRVPRLGHSMG